LKPNPQDEERGVARLLNPFDGPGTRRPKKLVDGALRSLGDGPPAGGPSRRSPARGTRVRWIGLLEYFLPSRLSICSLF